MRKITAVLLAMAMLLNASGCEAGSTQTANAQVKPTIPYNDRIFIYNNGLDIEYKDSREVDGSNVESDWRYPVISGLKDKEVQEQLNREIPSVLDAMLTQLEEEYPEGNGKIGKYERKDAYAYITYNCNNVIFIEYNAMINASFADGYYMPMNDYLGVGYDLNTGNRIGLPDLFKPGVDYEKSINTYISQYIIENNYDDYEYEMMTKPFQGIREDQNFSLNFDALVINIDEKNDDFVYYGYTNPIPIPLKYLGDDLYIFDKYFDEDKNIFERSKLTKKLFPNKIEFIPTKYLEEGNDKWHISIMQGELLNISDKTIEKRVYAMLEPVTDPEEFRREAEEYIKNHKDTDFYGDYIHNIEVPFNAGGYLSIISFDEIYRKDNHGQYRKTFNYDFNKEKEMKFMDLFINEIDVEAVMKKHIRERKYLISEAVLEEGIKAAINSNDFSFSENHLLFRFSPEGANVESYREWIWIGFEEFGLENISLFN